MIAELNRNASHPKAQAPYQRLYFASGRTHHNPPARYTAERGFFEESADLPVMISRVSYEALLRMFLFCFGGFQ